MRRSRWAVSAPALGIILAGVRLCAAWNGTGHQVIALIAWNNLSPEARAKVVRLLQAHPNYSSMLTKADVPADKKDRDAFLVAATWPDLVRTPTSPGAKYNHPVWHYVDFPYVIGELPAEDPKPEEPEVKWTPGTDPTNAAQAFAKCVAELGDDKLADGDRAVAMAWIEHLVGDIHQPLHAVSMFNRTLPKGDQGGNLLMVQAKESVSNLHALWDGMLGNYQSDDEIEQIAKRIIDAHPRKDLTEQLAVTDFEAWAKASFEQAKKDSYWGGKLAYLTREEQNKDRLRPVPAVPEGYMDKARADADADVALAGYRLADLLNRVLSDQPAK
jgi:S1/P1 Nuclease